MLTPSTMSVRSMTNWCWGSRRRCVWRSSKCCISACNKGRRRKPGEANWSDCSRPVMCATPVGRSSKTPISVCNKPSTRCFGSFVKRAVSARPVSGSNAGVWNCPCTNASKPIPGLWQVPTQPFIGSILHHPCYAGAYVWGQRHTELVVVEGKVIKRTSPWQRPEDCRVFIPDHHEGYMDWETFEENQRLMHNNTTKTAPDASVGAVRAGKALLAGLLRCGHCGRKMHVSYWGKSGTSPRYRCRGTFDAGGTYCVMFGGAGVDRRFTQELLNVISPLGLQASLEAIEGLNQREHEQRQTLEYKLVQLQYEAQRAFEQYNEVDPRHRLVAAELERRWNAKLEEVEVVQATLVALSQHQQALTDDERVTILGLGERFTEVWDSPHCPMALRKTIIRTVVKEVIVNEDAATERLQCIIHWQGGSHTSFEMPKPQWGIADKTAPDTIELIRQMAVRYSDEEIARVLNKHGRRTGKGNRWTTNRVGAARRRYVIDGHRRPCPDPEVFSLQQAARYCGVSSTTIKRLVASGVLKRDQVAPWASWEIKRADLESEVIRQALAHLQAAGKLPVVGNDSATQQTLFTHNQEVDNARYYEC